jgi:transcriptional regulator with XRE-family HTH domain
MRLELIRARKALALKQEELAQLVGTHKSHISRLEQEVSDGSPELWLKLEQVLNVPFQVLYQKDGSTEPLSRYEPAEDELIVRALKAAMKKINKENHDH